MAELQAIEPSLTFVLAPAGSTSPNFSVSFAEGSNGASGPDQVWASARLSASGTCYYLTDRSGGPVPLGTFRRSTPNAATCVADTTITASDGTW